MPGERLIADILVRAFVADQTGGWRLWDILHTSGMPPSVLVYSVVLNRLAVTPQSVSWAELQGSYNRMLHLLTTALDGLSHPDRRAKVASLSSALARGAAIRGEIKLALRCTLHLCVFVRFVPTLSVDIAKLPLSMHLDRVSRYSDLAGALAAAGMHDLALRIVRKLHDLGYTPRAAIDSLLNTYLRKYEPDRFARCVNLMYELGIQPDARIYKRSIMAAALFSDGNADSVKRTWKAIKKTEFGTDCGVLLCVVDCFARIANYSELMEFYGSELRPLLASTQSRRELDAFGDVAGSTFSYLLSGGAADQAIAVFADCLSAGYSAPVQWWILLGQHATQVSPAFRAAALQSPFGGLTVLSHSMTDILIGALFAMRLFEATKLADPDLIYSALLPILRIEGIDFTPSKTVVLPLVTTDRSDDVLEALALFKRHGSLPTPHTEILEAFL
jgi:hypothetical protein